MVRHGLAFLPAMVIGLVRAAIRIGGDAGGGFMIIVGVATIPWLLFLEQSARVRLTLPLIPIPLLWIAPFFILTGFGVLLG